MVRPVPIPNTAVKHCRADGSSLIDSARVGRRHSFLKAGTEMFRLFYLFLLPITLTTFPNHPLPHKLLNPSTHSSHLSITKKIGREFSLPFRAPHSKAAALLPISKGMFASMSLLRSFGIFRTFILQRCHPYEVKFMPGSRFQNLVAAEVTRLKPSENQSLLTSAATVLKEPHR